VLAVLCPRDYRRRQAIPPALNFPIERHSRGAPGRTIVRNCAPENLEVPGSPLRVCPGMTASHGGAFTMPPSPQKTASKSTTRIGAKVQPMVVSRTAGRCRADDWEHADAVLPERRPIESSPMTGAATAAPARWGGRPRHGTTMPTNLAALNGASRSEERHSRRSFHRAARGGALSGTARAESRVAKAAILSRGCRRLMVQTPANPGGLPHRRLRRSSIAARRPIAPNFYRDLPAGPFYGYKPGRAAQTLGRPPSQNWVGARAMMGRREKRITNGIVGPSQQTDFTEDLKKITVPPCW